MHMLGAKNTCALLRIFIISKTMAARGDSQTHEETILLIELWGDDHVQQQLDMTPQRNIDILRRVYAKTLKIGFRNFADQRRIVEPESKD